MSEDTFIANNADFEYLRDQGFAEDESSKLIHMRDHVDDQLEYREMVAEQHRLAFLRWLVEHDRIGQ